MKLILFVLVTFIFEHIEGIKSEENVKTCDEKLECCSASCKRAANVLQFNINTTENPCENFYKFACGGYEARTNLGHSSFLSYFTVLDAEIKNIIFDLVKKPITMDDHLPVKLVKQIYSLCIDQDKIDNGSVATLLNIFESLGGFPLLSGSWNATSFSLHEFLFRLQSIGFVQNTFFSIDVSGSEETGYQFQFGKPDFLDRRNMLTKGRNSSKVEKYFQYINETIIALGGVPSVIQESIEEILALEIELARTMTLDDENDNVDQEDEPESLRNHTVNVTDDFENITRDKNIMSNIPPTNLLLNDMNKIFEGFQWIEYINDTYSLFYNLTFNESVAVDYPLYYRGFSNLTLHTKNRTLYNFLLWRMIDSLVSVLPSKIQKIKAKYMDDYESEEDQPRNETCLDLVQQNFQVEIGYMFVMNYNKTYERSVRDTAESIRIIFKETLRNATWMKNSTRNEAMKKLDQMRFDISYPSILDNVTFVDEFYSDLTLQNESFLMSYLQLAVFLKTKEIKNRFGDNNVDIRFLDEISKAEPSYDTVDNALIIPASVLTEIFYAYNRTSNLNFGGIGSIMGREIAHGFNNEGRKHDSTGKEINWWDNSTETIYHNRSQCFVHQYETISNKTIDGKRTLDENLADNVGLTKTYIAYKRWVANNKPEKKLPGLPYDPTQIFWLEYAATMCEKMSDVYGKYILPGLLTSPPEYRVNIVVGNIEQFRRDWNCSSKSAMAFNHTCKLL